MKKILQLLFFLLSSNVSALVGVGTFVPHAFKAQVSTEGGREFFAINPYVALNAIVPIRGDHFFNPEIGYVFHTENDDETSAHTLFVSYNFTYKLNHLFILRYGLTTFAFMNGGDGEEVTLRNGNSTATFYSPDETRTSYVSSLDLGGEYFFKPRYSVRFQTYIARFLSSDARSVYYTLSVNYY
ncbi:MetA-pathway of phenol degradation domain protein [Bacteriovorax sp. BSW11_IV]|uniref:transporter n=1 Tax=Bacteriovorax sp. BSW11_IV TaxID=1353529 RepID=UPI00038A1FB1|nr:transporter [Bacteriovorax sp. BSW11_IV]EQC50299.1 MetA-pathway of phenol degradation domain protein [Bacteriovorax sp. BSW11_IV]